MKNLFEQIYWHNLDLYFFYIEMLPIPWFITVIIYYNPLLSLILLTLFFIMILAYSTKRFANVINNMDFLKEFFTERQLNTISFLYKMYFISYIIVILFPMQFMFLIQPNIPNNLPLQHLIIISFYIIYLYSNKQFLFKMNNLIFMKGDKYDRK